MSPAQNHPSDARHSWYLRNLRRVADTTTNWRASTLQSVQLTRFKRFQSSSGSSSEWSLSVSPTSQSERLASSKLGCFAMVKIRSRME